jgi:hypothetical protein
LDDVIVDLLDFDLRAKNLALLYKERLVYSNAWTISALNHYAVRLFVRPEGQGGDSDGALEGKKNGGEK